MIRKILPLVLAAFTFTACLPVGQIQVGVLEPTPSPTISVPDTAAPESTPEATLPVLEPTAVETPTPPPADPVLTPAIPIEFESILILEPGPGSVLTSPLRIRGEADSTFEQTLVIRLALEDGTDLALVPVMIQSPLGQRGPFEAEIDFSVTGNQPAFLQVYTTSARDGGITHLSSVYVTLSENGPAEVRALNDHAERIRIISPAIGADLAPGTVRVTGIALPSFEGTLIVELHDSEGNPISSVPIIVQAPDMGVRGPFEAELTLPGGFPGPGRVVVFDPSVAFAGIVHLASVEVTFVP